MSEWQPIATAPRDGTYIVLAAPGWPMCPLAKWDALGPSEDSDDDWYFAWVFKDENFYLPGCEAEGLICYDEDPKPTHWMPAPPQQSPEGE